MINLASAKLGAKALQCSDDSFAEMSRLLQDHAAVWKEIFTMTSANGWMAGSPSAAVAVGLTGV